MHALVAIPKKTILRVVQAHLEQMNIQVTSTENGLEAQDAIKAGTFDILITEEFLPYINGLELIEFARSMKIPTLLIGDTNSEQKVVEAFELGAADFISKPYSTGELGARVKNILNHFRI